MPKRTFTRKRGGGFFNTAKKVWSTMTGTRRVKPTYLNTNYGNALPPVNHPVTIEPKPTPKPKRGWINRLRTVRIPWKSRPTPAVSVAPAPEKNYSMHKYNSGKNSIQKELYFVGKSLGGEFPYVPENQPVPYLTPDEKHLLRERLVKYGIPRLQASERSRTQEQKKMQDDLLIQTVFGHDPNNFRDRFWTWSHERSAVPGKRPNPMQGSIGRLLPTLYYTDRELDYLGNSWDLGGNCTLDSFTSEGKSLQDPKACVASANTIDFLDTSKTPQEPFSDEFYIILHPHYFSTPGFQRGINRFYPNRKHFQRQIQLRLLPAHSSIVDAFANKGVMLVHPRLGWILQRDAPELWTMSYDLPFAPSQKPSNILSGNPPNFNAIREESKLNKLLRVIVLTLQKYTILRRWAWTKSPIWCSDVYETPFMRLAPELLRPDLHGDLYEFDLNQFNTELYDNQIWAAGTTIARNLDHLQTDPRFHALFDVDEEELSKPSFPWMIQETRQAEMRIRIPPLPEMEEEYERSFGGPASFAGSVGPGRSFVGSVSSPRSPFAGAVNSLQLGRASFASTARNRRNRRNRK